MRVRHLIDIPIIYSPFIYLQNVSAFMPYFETNESISYLTTKIFLRHIYALAILSYPPPLLIGVINDCDLLSRPGTGRKGPLRFRDLTHSVPWLCPGPAPNRLHALSPLFSFPIGNWALPSPLPVHPQPQF